MPTSQWGIICRPSVTFGDKDIAEGSEAAFSAVLKTVELFFCQMMYNVNVIEGPVMYKDSTSAIVYYVTQWRAFENAWVLPLSGCTCAVILQSAKDKAQRSPSRTVLFSRCRTFPSLRKWVLWLRFGCICSASWIACYLAGSWHLKMVRPRQHWHPSFLTGHYRSCRKSEAISGTAALHVGQRL